VHLADDLIDAAVPCLKQMAEVFATHGGSVIGVQTVPPQDTDKYGIVSLDRRIAPRVAKMAHIVEKPKPDKAPSNLAVVGRYLLTAAIFEDLAKIGQGAGGEIQLTDGIARLLQREAVYAFEFEGKRYDCGSKLGYLQATVEYGLKHPSLGREFGIYLSDFVAKQSTAAAKKIG
jgi:UTP--glucose-1-phosphate uridylyltransferase